MGKLIWIASYPKSGNTWVRIFLNTILINPEKPLSINEISRLTVNDAKPYLYQKLSGRSISELDRDELASYRPQVHREMAKLHPNPVLVKTHSILGAYNGIPFLTPEVTAAAVYLVRNPLDIVASYANHRSLDLEEVVQRIGRENWVIGNPKSQTPAVPSYVSSWSTNVRSWTEKQQANILVLRYEDLLETPAETFSRLVRFFNLNRSEEEIARAIRFTTLGEFRKQEAAEGFHERSDAGGRFFRRGQAGGWREELTEDQASRIVERHREQMQRFGYLPEGM
ncbi:MAG: sulfotransferase domain-containing protein [Rhodovibrionaceae bacterium]